MPKVKETRMAVIEKAVKCRFKRSLPNGVKMCFLCLRACGDDSKLLNIQGKTFHIHQACFVLNPVFIKKQIQSDPGSRATNRALLDVNGLKKSIFLAEVERAMKTRCTECGKKGGILGCSEVACRATFHVSCLNKSRGFANYRYPYVIYCNRHLDQPTALLAPYNIQSLQFSEWGGPPDGANCHLCEKHIEYEENNLHAIRPTCCENSQRRWFHRECLQQHCNSHDACPICQDKRKFKQFAFNYGLLLGVENDFELDASQALDAAAPHDVVCMDDYLGMDDALRKEFFNEPHLWYSLATPTRPNNSGMAVNIATDTEEQAVLQVTVLDTVSKSRMFSQGVTLLAEYDEQVASHTVEFLFYLLKHVTLPEGKFSFLFEVVVMKKRLLSVQHSLDTVGLQSCENTITSFLRNGWLSNFKK